MKRCRDPRVFVIVNSVMRCTPDDFNSTQLKDLGLELSIYIDNYELMKDLPIWILFLNMLS